MREWMGRLVNDKDGNPNEHIIAAILGSFTIIGLSAVLIYTGHPPSLPDFGIAHGAVWTAAGAGSRLSGGC